MNWPGFRRAFRLPLGKRGVKGDVAAELDAKRAINQGSRLAAEL